MLPFHIACTTCRASLKVAKPEAIGLILACPKCGGMVQVDAPEGYDASVDPMPAATDVNGSTATAAPPVVAPPTQAVAATFAEPTSRAIWWIGGGAIAATCAAAVAVILLLRETESPTSVARLPQAPFAEPATEPTTERAIEPTPEPSTEPTIDEPASPENNPATTPAAADKPPVPPAPGATLTTPGPVIEPRVVPAPNAPAVVADAPRPPAVVAPRAETSPTQGDRVPAKLVLEPTPAHTPAESPLSAAVAPPIPPEPSAADVVAVPNEAPPAEADIPSPAADATPAPPVAVPFVAVGFSRIDPSRYEATLAGVNYERITLRNYLADFSDLVGGPIGVEWRDLERTGWNTEIPVRAHFGRITAGDALRGVLKPMALDVRSDVKYAWVVAAADETPTRGRYVVEDLFEKKEAQAQPVADALRRMIQPGSWTADGITWTDGTFLLQQNATGHDEAIVWLEKLRVARGLPLRTKHDPQQPQLRRFHPDRFALTTRATRAAELSAVPVTAAFPRAETLETLIEFLSGRTGAVILWDYPALAAADVSPQSTSALTVEAAPLSETFRVLLEPAGLVAAPIDARTFVITTRAETERRPIVEWYPLAGETIAGRLPEGADALREWLLARLKKTGAERRLPPDAFFWDAPSRTLVVRADAPTQIEIERLLSPPARVAGKPTK